MNTNFSSSYTPGQTEQPQLPKPPKEPFNLLKFAKHHWVGIVIIIASLIASAVLIFLLKSVVFHSPNVIVPPKKPKPVYYSKLSGLPVETEADTTRPITAIMIENSPDARPQSGLKQAEVVFEAVAEGGITRFLTLFQTHQPQLIGPVRSLRMYYIDWLTPYQASVAHVGGSAEALAEIRSGRHRDIDQMFNAGSYWRSTDRSAPHNVYTSFEKLNALNKSKGYTNSNPDSLTRRDPKPVKQPTAANIVIDISSHQYNTSYVYDQPTNKYIRSQAGAVHADREEGPITPDTVVAMKVDMSLAADRQHQNIATIGSGEAVIFQNGEVIAATWRKPSRDQLVKFYDASGEEVSINRGQLWIAAVPNGSGSVTWQ